MRLFDGEGEVGGLGLAGGISDGEGVGGGLFGGDVSAVIGGGPDAGVRWIESDGLNVGDAVAELGRFAAADDTGRGVKMADGEVRAAELVDGGAVGFALLLCALLN